MEDIDIILKPSALDPSLHRKPWKKPVQLREEIEDIENNEKFVLKESALDPSLHRKPWKKPVQLREEIEEIKTIGNDAPGESLPSISEKQRVILVSLEDSQNLPEELEEIKKRYDYKHKSNLKLFHVFADKSDIKSGKLIAIPLPGKPEYRLLFLLIDSMYLFALLLNNTTLSPEQNSVILTKIEDTVPKVFFYGFIEGNSSILTYLEKEFKNFLETNNEISLKSLFSAFIKRYEILIERTPLLLDIVFKDIDEALIFFSDNQNVNAYKNKILKKNIEYVIKTELIPKLDPSKIFVLLCEKLDFVQMLDILSTDEDFEIIEPLAGARAILDEELGGGSRKKSNKKDKFNFTSHQKHEQKGKKTIKKVHIKNGKGTKSVAYYHKGKHIHTAKKPLTYIEIAFIKVGKFIPGLFKDCPCNKKTRRRKRKNEK